MATGSLDLGLDSSEEMDSAMKLIPRRNRLLCENFQVIHLERERGHMYMMKSLFQLLKLRFHGKWATLFHTRFPPDSFSVPSPMAASKKGHQNLS
jgi:hypothetical protein